MKKLILLIAILTVVVPPTQRTTEKIVFLVDKSLSMDATKTSDAMQQFVNVITRQDPSMDVEVCVYSFETKTVRWPYGWQKMPSATVVNAAQKFLSIPAEGSTAVVPAIRRAMFEPKKKLTIIIISDGDFDESDSHILKTIRKQQGYRKLLGRPAAIIGCIGVGPWESDSLKSIATAGKGGYYHVKKKKKKKK